MKFIWILWILVFSMQSCISTADPTRSPSADPTRSPSSDPTRSPSADPTRSPSADPTGDATADPTGDPTRSPTADPTRSPTSDPTRSPTADPTRSPSNKIDSTANPTGQPTPSPNMESCEEAQDIDVVFLIDTSSHVSPEQCDERQEFVAELLTSVKGVNNNVRVAYATFGAYDNIEITIDLIQFIYNDPLPVTQENLNAFYNVVRNEPCTTEIGNEPSLDAALQTAYDQFQNVGQSELNGRDKKVIIVSNNYLGTEQQQIIVENNAASNELNNINVFMVNIGASPPNYISGLVEYDNDRLFNIPNINDQVLDDIIPSIQQQICSEPTNEDCPVKKPKKLKKDTRTIKQSFKPDDLTWDKYKKNDATPNDADTYLAILLSFSSKYDVKYKVKSIDKADCQHIDDCDKEKCCYKATVTILNFHLRVAFVKGDAKGDILNLTDNDETKQKLLEHERLHVVLDQLIANVISNAIKGKTNSAVHCKQTDKSLSKKTLYTPLIAEYKKLKDKYELLHDQKPVHHEDQDKWEQDVKDWAKEKDLKTLQKIFDEKAAEIQKTIDEMEESKKNQGKGKGKGKDKSKAISSMVNIDYNNVANDTENKLTQTFILRATLFGVIFVITVILTVYNIKAWKGESNQLTK